MEVDRFHCRAMIDGMDTTLLVLAGGQGRRMGRAKAWLEVGDTTLVQWMIKRFAHDFSEVLVSFATPEQIEVLLPHRLVFDRKPDSGPLGGIEAGLSVASHDTVFAIACDMPNVTSGLAHRIVLKSAAHDAAIPRLGGRPEPVVGAYRRSALPAITAALDAGALKAADALVGLDVGWLDDLDPDLFSNLNTPEDYVRFRSSTRHTSDN